MIKNWELNEINLGILKPMKKVTIVFKCLESLEDAATVTSSCGCSSGHVSGNTVVVDFKPANIPTHLQRSGVKSHVVRKTIRVHYKDGQQDVLQFYGTLKI